MNRAEDCRIILASSSPRRRQLLADAGYEFDIVAPPIAESDEETAALGPCGWAESLAYFKAKSVQELHDQRCVLGADTIVSLQGAILGKPADGDEARTMLRSLSRTRHGVITGVALLGPDGLRLIASDTTYITMRAMSDQEIEQYVQSGEWIGKAGAYAIQETADRFVETVEGSFTNVVGLPMELVERMMQELHEHPTTHRTR